MDISQQEEPYNNFLVFSENVLGSIPQVTGRANSSKPSFISFVRITDDGKLLARFENKCL